MTQPPIPTPPPVKVPADTTPLLLFPVRIETRFVDSGGTSQLCVRIYPDQAMANGHHLELTSAELAAGNAYWDAAWRAGNPPPPGQQDATEAPWRGLAARYGSPRAAWIVRQTTPVNIAQQPASPTPDGQPPSPAPQQPSPPVSGGSSPAAATAAVLPPAWTVALVSDGAATSFTGPPVTPDLALSLSLSPAELPVSGAFTDGMPVDAGMRWLVDFNAAVAAGMGLRIPLTAQQRSAGFDRVLVYGVAPPGTPGAQQVAALLDAHHYSDGLAFVPQGAPTNNTPDAPSAYSSDDPGAVTSFTVELGAPLTGQADADGPVAAQLLGVPVTTFDHVHYADRHDQRDGSDMLTALWPATIGYFLRQMSDGGLTEAQLEQARTWAIAHVRPRGPLPALRTGKIPYGVLPVSSMALWSPDIVDPVESTVLQMIQRLLPVWKSSAAAAPHVGATPGDPDADLAHVLGMDASSMSFRARHIFGDQLLWNLMSFLAVPATARNTWWQQHLAPARTQLNNAGYTLWNPRVSHTGMSPADFPVTSPTVVAGPLSETDPVPADATFGGQQVNYITWLRHASISDIRADNYPGPSVPDTLLYKILRQSVLLDYVTLAQSAQLSTGQLTVAQTHEQEMVRIAAVPIAAAAVPAAAQIVGPQIVGPPLAGPPGIPPTVNPPVAGPPPAAVPPLQVTPWDVLARPVSANQKVTWGDFLVGLQPVPGSPFERLAELRASMDRLAALPTAELDRLLTETLDACSHRLDVWLTSLVTARLTRQRAAALPGPSALRAGGYGFVENLRPAQPLAPVSAPAAQLVAQLDAHRAVLFPNAPQPTSPLQAPADNGGFIHAPSMAQAATAAVLRSGYLSHQGGSEDGLLALDLSSDRVRMALYLLDGVRQGQPLGALLGYQLEQGMHAAALDPFIQPLRDRFPITAGKLTPTSPTDEVAGASDVVDALALDRARRDGTLAPAADWGTGLPAPGPARDSLLALFAALDDVVDAISDLAVAESVHQTLRGNPDRAGGASDGISRAQRSPEPQIVDTPRGGIDQIHRVAALFAGPLARPASWASIPVTARALAEPALDAWVASLLPEPAAIQAKITYTAGGVPAVTAIVPAVPPVVPPVTATVHLSDLGVGPLDVLAMCRITTDGQRSELDERIIYAAVPVGATGIAISYAGAPGAVTFADLLNLGRVIDDLIGGSRALTASDLATPEAAIVTGIDVAELNGRATAARDGLESVVDGLAAAAVGSLTPDAARDAITAASGYGVTGAIPPSRRGSGPDPALAAQAATLHDTLAGRAAAMASVTLSATDPAPALDLLSTAFARSLPVLPLFSSPDAATLGAAFAQDPALIGATPAAIERWLQQLTHVRAGVSRLDLALLTAGLVSGMTPPSVGIAQLPAVPADHWLALPAAPGSTPVNGRLAIAALVTGDPTSTSVTWSGLLVDAWPERVPSARESAGVAFHHDEPKARAPQALLLAVCPDLIQGWNDAALVQLLQETLDLARLRTVDLGSVGPVGQVLPALYLPFNPQGETVSMIWKG
jgi:hypothetical protein